jgi:hypothetical protein
VYGGRECNVMMKYIADKVAYGADNCKRVEASIVVIQ